MSVSDYWIMYVFFTLALTVLVLSGNGVIERNTAFKVIRHHSLSHERSQAPVNNTFSTVSTLLDSLAV